MLVVQNVSKNFGSFQALHDVNLEFHYGVYGLLAPNGAGKTTLIKMLTTLLFPTSGEILYEGQEIIKLDERYRAVLGYLPQEFGYYKHDTPTKYLLYLAALKGMSRNEAKERVVELLRLVALEDVAHKKMKKFSGGMIQRVGIAQAMLNDPKILILDEPTAGLDPKERVRFRNLITDLARNRIVILSTHIVSDVESIANEIIMIKDKQVLYKDTVSNICRKITGLVYETEVQFDEAANFRKKYLSLSEKQENGKMLIRFLTNEPAQHHWKEVSPSLEDVFLHLYQDEVSPS
ncbi:ABC transporter ATP-binding protein [Metabacillus iocasae]|uniref:ABC-type multidrug transport system ATPase subunit n=1 Tax=Priestia iocasae TaxID=2291674 RepID=A0ABS2QTN6_9BACI|nr:ABC transporter ATP-binding protein [Metabacillus iocasae]MBM7702797.1 ABC-type multidrug transport system ATPase subunit [Metabacillus iocasae]